MNSDDVDHDLSYSTSTLGTTRHNKQDDGWSSNWAFLTETAVEFEIF